MATDTEAFATKADLDAGLAALEERFGLRLQTGLAQLGGELRTEMAELRGDLESLLRGQTWRLSGLLVVTLGVGITLARLA